MRRSTGCASRASVACALLLAGCALGEAPAPGAAAPSITASPHADATTRGVTVTVGAPDGARELLVVRYRADLPVDPPSPDAVVGAAAGGGEVVLRAPPGAGGALSLEDDDPYRCAALVYRAWAVRADGALSPPASAVVADGALRLPTGAPSALSAQVSGGAVSLAWVNGAGPDFAVARLERSGAPIAEPGDGALVYEGPAASFSEPIDPAWGPSVRYAVFACDACGVCDPSGPNVTAALD